MSILSSEEELFSDLSLHISEPNLPPTSLRVEIVDNVTSTYHLKLLLKCNHCIHTSIIREIAILDEFDNYLVNSNMHYLNVLMIKIKIIPF